MAANLNVIESAQIASNPGNLTDEIFAVDNNIIKRGEYCYLAAGKLKNVVTTAGTAQVLENDVAPFASTAPHRWFIALEDLAANQAKAKVVEVTRDTILEGFIVTDNANGVVTSPGQAAIGAAYEGYVDANGRLAINRKTTKGIFHIVDIDTNYQPYRHPDAAGFDKDSTGVRHARVKFRIPAARCA
jgi:hypothetical protein